MDTTNHWWYEINREQNGPVPEQEIKDLISRGTLKKRNLVWKEGLEAWIPIHETELNGHVKNTTTSKMIDESEKLKWYNNKTKLGLSILFWPAFVYGMYKTALIEKKTKQTIGGIGAFIVIVGLFGVGDKPRTICGHYQMPRKASFLYPEGGYWPGSDVYIGNFLDEKCSDEGPIKQVLTMMGRTEERIGSYKYNKSANMLYINFRDNEGPTSVHISDNGTLEWGDGYVQTRAFQ